MTDIEHKAEVFRDLIKDGDKLFDIGKYEESIRYYNNVIVLINNRIEFKSVVVEAYYHKAKSLAALGEFEAVEACYMEAKELDPMIEAFYKVLKYSQPQNPPD